MELMSVFHTASSTNVYSVPMLVPPHSPGPPPLVSVPAQIYNCHLAPECMLPLEATSSSIADHLRTHGYEYKHRQRARCPWAGCSQELWWTNVTRHIKGSHLGVKIRCERCGKEYKRKETLAVHMTKCSGDTPLHHDDD